MMFEIEMAEGAIDELQTLTAFRRRQVVQKIKEQLVHEPTTSTRNKKRLPDVAEAGFEFRPPLWELRIGDLRVFYDVETDVMKVFVRAIRRKPPTKTTKDVLQ